MIEVAGFELPDPRGLQVERISIQHAEGVYLLNEALPLPRTSYAIMLGAITQRVMYASVPQCSSKNGEIGHPTNHFPVKDDQNIWHEDVVKRMQEDTTTGLACGSCLFQKWKVDEGGRRVRPPCVIQVTVPMIVRPNPDEPQGVLGAMSYQKSSEPPIREYMREFVKMKRPAYSAVTEMRLNKNLGRGFTYSTPVFSTRANIGEEHFAILSQYYRKAKEILTTPPSPQPIKAAGGMLSVAVEPASTSFSGKFFG